MAHDGYITFRYVHQLSASCTTNFTFDVGWLIFGCLKLALKYNRQMMINDAIDGITSHRPKAIFTQKNVSGWAEVQLEGAQDAWPLGSRQDAWTRREPEIFLHPTWSQEGDSPRKIWLVVWNINSIFPLILGFQSSQLTFIFFRRVAQPPTRKWHLFDFSDVLSVVFTTKEMSEMRWITSVSTMGILTQRSVWIAWQRVLLNTAQTGDNAPKHCSKRYYCTISCQLKPILPKLYPIRCIWKLGTPTSSYIQDLIVVCPIQIVIWGQGPCFQTNPIWIILDTDMPGNDSEIPSSGNEWVRYFWPLLLLSHVKSNLPFFAFGFQYAYCICPCFKPVWSMTLTYWFVEDVQG